MAGVKQTTISASERQGVGSVASSRYARILNVDPYWLSTGQGEMQPDGPLPTALDIRRTLKRLGELLREVPNTERLELSKKLAAFAFASDSEQLIDSLESAFAEGSLAVPPPQTGGWLPSDIQSI